MSEHQHHHGPHHHKLDDPNRGYAAGFALNLVFVLIEAGAGISANSLALLADAGHNLSDLLGLAVAWAALLLARQRPSSRFTYGLRGSSIWAALFNALVLLVACGGIAWEALQRLHSPAPVPALTLIIVASIGVLINTATALMFMRGRELDLNRRAVFLHMAADAAISLGVVIAGGLIMLTNWNWLDPAISLVIVAVIVIGTWGLLKNAVSLALHAVPAGIDPANVRAYLCGLPGVKDVHDLHIWAMSTTETALTAHLAIPGERPADAFYADVCIALEQRFGIHHSTIQVERGDGVTQCRQAPEEVV